MSTYRDLLRWGRELLSQAQVADSELDAWYLMEYVFDMDRAHYFLRDTEEADQREAEYRSLVEKRAKRIPLQHLTGQAWFMGLEFYVDGRVLIPRQDTEVLVEEALKRLADGQKVLDMCTGSGCILISLLRERPSCQGVGADLSREALEVAKINGDRLGVDAQFVRSDLFTDIRGKYDMIVSNPPYIPTGTVATLEQEVQGYDPAQALDGGVDGLDFYRGILEQAADYLEDGGWLLLEIGHDQGEAVRGQMEARGYRQLQVVRDLAGRNRVVLGRREDRRI